MSVTNSVLLVQGKEWELRTSLPSPSKLHVIHKMISCGTPVKKLLSKQYRLTCKRTRPHLKRLALQMNVWRNMKTEDTFLRYHRFVKRKRELLLFRLF